MNEEKMVEVVKAAKASKLSPRSGGRIGYEVGRCEGAAMMRLTTNEGGGKFSKEWLPLASIEAALPTGASEGMPFHAAALAGAFRKRSHNNQCFLAAVLRAEGVLETAGEKAGQSVLARTLEEWAGEIRGLEAIRVEPLEPAKPKKKSTTPPDSGAEKIDVKPVESEPTEPNPDAESGDVVGISEGTKPAAKQRGRKRRAGQAEADPQSGAEADIGADAPAETDHDQADEEAG